MMILLAPHAALAGQEGTRTMPAVFSWLGDSLAPVAVVLAIIVIVWPVLRRRRR